MYIHVLVNLHILRQGDKSPCWTSQLHACHTIAASDKSESHCCIPYYKTASHLRLTTFNTYSRVLHCAKANTSSAIPTYVHCLMISVNPAKINICRRNGICQSCWTEANIRVEWHSKLKMTKWRWSMHLNESDDQLQQATPEHSRDLHFLLDFGAAWLSACKHKPGWGFRIGYHSQYSLEGI